MLREHDVRSVVKHREFDSPATAHNAPLDDGVDHSRSVVECSVAFSSNATAIDRPPERGTDSSENSPSKLPSNT